ncbi:GDSL esterase/lipase At1g29670-like [Salvia miltiorrhiza]|uniref:GDSL esterase/lipase At1g29670-like n=1 Tax=Salvia miltiorrhiza TaxID=226208 RepID=UPI0025AB9506|nr:GDSL esterase/lipase At1g29670-like [Salvia miltiorrhiza]
MMSKNLPVFCAIVIFGLFTQSSTCTNTKHGYKTKGMFVFGSSLVDNGNNNFLRNSFAKADFSPYGVDFPLGASGRFTNGENVIDILGKKLQLPGYIPPFNDPSTRGTNIVHGVNFASGGSGILDNTGALAGNVTSLNEQISNFEKVSLPELEQQLGSNNRKKRLSDYLFVVGSGGNDYSLNYFLGLAGANVSLQAFTTNLTATLSTQLKRLHGLGARKFVLMAINPNGCSPMATARVPTQEGCVENLNRASLMFNANLKNLVDDIRPQMPASKLVFVNSYNILSDIITSPTSQGFRDASSSCCEVRQVSEGGTGILCKRGGSICTNRSEYVFFDGLHPTEAVNDIIATKAFSSLLRAEVYPYNVRKLSQI